MAGAVFVLLATLTQDSTATVRRLIDELRSEKGDVREEARRQLMDLGRKAAPELERAARDKDPELVASAQSLLRALSIADRLPPRLIKGVPGLEYRLAADKHAWTTSFLELAEDWPDAVELDDIETLAPTALREAVGGDERKLVIEKVRRWEFRNTIPDLLKLLDDPETRRNAAWALAEMEVKDAIPPLIQMLEDQDHDALLCAIYCLERLDARRAIPGIRKLLTHENPIIQGRAATTLGSMGDKASAPELMRLLHDDLPFVRQHAVRSLGFLREESALLEITALLKDKDPEMRGVAAMALGSLKAKSSAPDLLACLKDENAGVRTWACYSLAGLGVDAAIPALVPLLQDQPLQVRQAALSGLVELRATAAIPQITPLLKEKDPNLTLHAARCLCALGSREGVPTILEGKGVLARLSVLNLLRSPRRTKELGERAVPGSLEGTIPDLVRNLKDASQEPVELPELKFLGGPGRVLLLRCDGSPTLLSAWETLASKLHAPGPCDVIVDEDRIRILPREQALAFCTAWYLKQQKK